MNAMMPNAGEPMGTPAIADFNSSNVVGGSKSFLDSNSYVAKAAFLIFTVLGFVYVLRVGIALIGWLFAPNSSPYLVNGMIDASVGNLTIQQDPSQENAVTILRSTNDAAGIAFTWSVWIYITQNAPTNRDGTKYLHVFNKGSATTASDGTMSPNNGPGLYLKDDYSGLRVVMSTFDNPSASVDVDNIPINKWFSVIIRVENTVLDVFINGDLAKRLPLDSVPFQNSGNVNVAQNHGFTGLISSLRYYNTALGTRAISNIISSGPNLTVIGSSGGAPGIMDYLSSRWFSTQWNA